MKNCSMPHAQPGPSTALWWCFSTAVLTSIPMVPPTPLPGGLDLLGRSREEHFEASQLAPAKATCQALRLDGLILIGGMDRVWVQGLGFWV